MLVYYLISLLFGGSAFLFFWLRYPGHVLFQEQQQLFLWTWDYAEARLRMPGGAMVYAGEFLTQFFIRAWSGALLLALLLVGIQWGVWQLIKRQQQTDKQTSGPSALYALSFIPAVLVAYFLCNEHFLLPSVLSVLLVLWGAVGLWDTESGPSSQCQRLALRAVTVLGLFWLTGPACLLFCLLPRKRDYLFWGMATAVVALLPWLTAPASLPVAQCYAGLGIYRYPMEHLSWPWLLWGTTWASVFLGRFKPARRGFQALCGLFVLLGGFFLIRPAVNLPMEEAFVYDHYVQTEQWDKIIKKAQRKTPTSPTALTCLNLALAQTHQSGDLLFSFFQNGTQGLVPSFGGDSFSPLTTAEVFYRLGLINEAQHYVFEAMEAIPNFQKSARCYRRLAQTNAINGQYAVAQKYVLALQQTLFYRKWATTLSLHMTSDPSLEALRQSRLDEDAVFASAALPQTLCNLYLKNPYNRLAFDYLMMYTLLNKEWGTVPSYYELAAASFTSVPFVYQQALAFAWWQQNGSLEGIPWTVSQDVKTGLHNFVQTLSTYPEEQAQRLLAKSFGHTYWYYLYFIF